MVLSVRQVFVQRRSKVATLLIKFLTLVGVCMQGLENANGEITLVPVNSQGLVYTRTPAEVLAIVTLGSTNGRGGFFPDGLNGALGAPTS